MVLPDRPEGLEALAWAEAAVAEFQVAAAQQGRQRVAQVDLAFLDGVGRGRVGGGRGSSRPAARAASYSGESLQYTR
ncbi:hypothetical protein [Bailinhaonella thermotolerans]|uniref:Uncharacterized protein n=1 Tax=Bailinhaonella thermotolerans TaxID=1070861 RepID=A0A3A4AUA4_9ACTN|nr:hypothetical protein [Bailinhaonella thermotolerans]RJL31875.1 hypothetical protein D5H75_15550 [Bailinhaonella thermotolerans]